MMRVLVPGISIRAVIVNNLETRRNDERQEAPRTSADQAKTWRRVQRVAPGRGPGRGLMTSLMQHHINYDGPFALFNEYYA